MPVSLLDTLKQAKLILIEDSFLCGGIGLLKSFLCTAKEQAAALLYEDNKDIFTQDLPLSVSNRLEIHDFASDPLGWNGNSKTTVNCDIVKYLKSSQRCGKQDKIVIGIDSLSNLILYRSPSYTCQVLHKLVTQENVLGIKEVQLIAILHKDVHDAAVLSQLEHTATAVINVSPPKSHDYDIMCSILHKKPTGKIIRMKEEYKFGKGYEIISHQEVKQSPAPVIQESNVDPTANLTFNLSLKESEKEARSQVPLPYMYDKQRQEDVLKKSVGEGKIFYQPDEVDDFDEDDPDDDLDI